MLGCGTQEIKSASRVSCERAGEAWCQPRPWGSVGQGRGCSWPPGGWGHREASPRHRGILPQRPWREAREPASPDAVVRAPCPVPLSCGHQGAGSWAPVAGRTRSARGGGSERKTKRHWQGPPFAARHRRHPPGGLDGLFLSLSTCAPGDGPSVSRVGGIRRCTASGGTRGQGCGRADRAVASAAMTRWAGWAPR